MVSVRIGPGFDTLHEMEHGRVPLTGFRILPFIGHAIVPPDLLRSIAPRRRHGAVGFEFVHAPRIILPGRQIPCFEHDHKIPTVLLKESKQRPIRISAVGEDGQPEFGKPRFHPFGQSTKGLPFRILLGLLGIRTNFQAVQFTALSS